MSENHPEIEIFQSNVFKKSFARLSEKHQYLVDEEIGLIVENPEIGTRKKGDLAHLWVHKFKLDSREILLGYSWIDQKLELYLLHLGTHENFYQSAKKRRDADREFSF